MPPTDDPTDPVDAPTRRRVSGAALLDAIEALPDRIAARVSSGGSGGEDDDTSAASPLPPEVTFEGEPPPESDPDVDDVPPPADELEGPSRRRSGFPRRKR